MRTDGAVYDETSEKTKFPLCLLSKVSPLEDLDVEMEKAKISSLKLALELMVKQPKEKLLESRMPAQEIIGSKASTSTEHAHKKGKAHSSKDHDASQEAQMREEPLQILQKAGYFTKAGNKQEFFNLLAEEIKNKYLLPPKRKSEIETSKQALEGVKGTFEKLQNRIDIYKTFRKNCIEYLVSEESGIDREVQKIYYTEDEAVFNAKELFKKGVIVNTQGEFWEMEEFIYVTHVGEKLRVKRSQLWT